MKTIALCAILCSAALCCAAATLSVALDGSQQYTSIQTAIDASTHGDIVLVYPGRYHENLNFNGKNITLASLELTTGNVNYKYTTIIDGSRNGAVITSINYESNIVIRGFTITNGTGEYSVNYDLTVGGGILVGRMSGQRNVSIINCYVHGNTATLGGGLWISACNLFISGVTIKNNRASVGGGIMFPGVSGAQFNTTYDPVNRCSIYNNIGSSGSDMYYYLVNAVHVVVDTFTVANPWNFYACAIAGNSSIVNPYTFDILNTVHTEVNHDLYVAPWGDNNNSGVSPIRADADNL
ncbi:MAG: hypothetical protein Q8M98_06240 [Candidatus Cloacimonadaceae bacterium]|nr:hypothetical protein [Candidatus Cloacimonadaceae bacterium]